MKIIVWAFWIPILIPILIVGFGVLILQSAWALLLSLLSTPWGILAIGLFIALYCFGIVLYVREKRAEQEA
jgi:hypothetical protein